MRCFTRTFCNDENVLFLYLKGRPCVLEIHFYLYFISLYFKKPLSLVAPIVGATNFFSRICQAILTFFSLFFFLLIRKLGFSHAQEKWHGVYRTRPVELLHLGCFIFKPSLSSSVKFSFCNSIHLLFSWFIGFLSFLSPLVLSCILPCLSLCFPLLIILY